MDITSIYGVEKNIFYENLARFLLDAQKKYEDGSIGWARETNIAISSCMNTSEVLLGLLSSCTVISQGQISKKIQESIAGGINYLIKYQKQSGGWTTSENNEKETAEGNVVYTSLAVWCMVEYVLIHEEPRNLKEHLDNAYSFFCSCKIDSVRYKFRPSVGHTSKMCSIYALIGLVNLFIYYDLAKEEEKVKDLCQKINEFIKDAIDVDYSFFESIMLFLALKKIEKFEICKGEDFYAIYNKCSHIVCNLTKEQYFSNYIDKRFVRENGEQDNFTYCSALWVLAAISYGKSTQVPYKNELLSIIANTYIKYTPNGCRVIVSDREWTWAVAQTLMSFSMLSTTEKMSSFLKIQDNPIEKDSVYIVYGRNIIFRDSIKALLSILGFKCSFYSNNCGNTTSTYDAFANGIKKTELTIVLMTGDDEGKLCEKYLNVEDKNDPYETTIAPQPRLNVVFETGFSYGLRNGARTIVISTNNIRRISDISAVNRLVIHTDSDGNLLEDSVTKFKKDLIYVLQQCNYVIPQEKIDNLEYFRLSIK